MRFKDKLQCEPGNALVTLGTIRTACLLHFPLPRTPTEKMTLAYWCILIAGVMPIMTVAVAKLQRGYDNHNPRDWLEKQQGIRKRADYAHRNHFEAFPFFAVAVIIAQQLNVSQASIDLLAGGFIAARIGYTFFYLADRPVLRSTAFLVAYGCILGMFLLAAIKA